MAFVKKVWKDRIAEYINRRLLTKEDGTQELVTVARNEGNISQEGDAFNAANMNDLEERIANEFQVLNEGLLRYASFQYDIATEPTQYGGWNYGEKSFLNDINKLGYETVFAIIPVIVTPGNGINIPQNVGIRGSSVYLQSSSLIKATVKVYVVYH